MDTLPRFPLPIRSCLLAVCFCMFVMTAGCGSSISTITAPGSSKRCEITLETRASTLQASGGTGTVTVKTERECQWTATSDAAWLTLSGGTTGQGDGTIQYSVGVNVDPVQRTGAIVANDKRVEVTQTGGECKFELGSSSTSFPNLGGSNTVQVRASSAMCSWTATSHVDWIDIRSGRDGKGSGAVVYEVAATAGPPRTGTLTVAGQTVTVTQGQVCTYTIGPEHQSIPASGGNSSFSVAAADGCVWNVRSNADWIAISSAASGTGTASVAYSVAVNQGPSRTGTITAAGRTFTVEQVSGCTYTISPARAELGVVGQTVTVSVATAQLCTWTAKSNASWIGVSSGASGRGSGNVQLAVASNTTSARSGTATIAGQTFTIAQAGCTATLSPTYQLIPPPGAVGAFQVNTIATCPWNAVPSASWIRITSGGSGAGVGTVGFITDPNPGPARNGTIDVLNQKFLVQQEAGGM
jgi:BACON domain-containing protein/all-beta uncharacterized protein